MFKLELWQWLVVAAVALAPVGVMSTAILRMFPTGDANGGTTRPATPLESGFYGVTAQPGASVFDVWSYRVQARYAGRARIVIADDGTVSVAGPRVGAAAYRAWIWLQTLLLALVPAALVGAAVRLDWRWLLLGIGLLLLSTGVMGIGAGIWPGAGEVKLVAEGAFEATEFPASAIKDLGIGKWATDGMQVALFHYKPMIDQLAKENAVTFTAPDGSGHRVRYALHCYDEGATRRRSRRSCARSPPASS